LAIRVGKLEMERIVWLVSEGSIIKEYYEIEVVDQWKGIVTELIININKQEAVQRGHVFKTGKKKVKNFDLNCEKLKK